MKPIEFKIPIIPLSYNQSFMINYHTRQTYLTAKAREFKKLVHMACPPAIVERQAKLLFYMEVHSSKWFTKEGKIRRIDVANLDRLLIDAVFSKIQGDDSQLFDVRLVKRVSEDEFTYVKLSEFKDE